MCLMLFLARFSYRRDTRFISPPNFLILFKARCRTLRCYSFDKPFPESIWLLDRYS